MNKTSKTIAKRMRKIKGGIKIWRSGWSHYKTGKPHKKLKKLRKPKILEGKEARNFLEKAVR